MPTSAPPQRLHWRLVRHYLEPIQAHLSEEGVTGIFVNRFDTVYVMRRGELERVGGGWDSEFHLVSAIEQIANALGQEVHAIEHPLLDARLEDGSRINAVLSPTAVGGSNMSVRLFPRTTLTAEALVLSGTLDRSILAFLRAVTLQKRNIVVAGGTGSGKTTLLNVMSGFIPPGDRVVTIEDTAELKIDTPHWVALEAAERSGARGNPISMSRLVKNALRMEPQRLVIGEVRDAAAAEALLSAANTGTAGIMCTIHANSEDDTIDRITNLASAGAATIPYEHIHRQVKKNFDVMVHVQRTGRGARRIVELSELVDGTVRTLWRWNVRLNTHEAVGTSVLAAELME